MLRWLSRQRQAPWTLLSCPQWGCPCPLKDHLLQPPVIETDYVSTFRPACAMQNVACLLLLHHPVQQAHACKDARFNHHHVGRLERECFSACSRQIGKAQDQRTFGFEGLEAAVPF